MNTIAEDTSAIMDIAAKYHVSVMDITVNEDGSYNIQLPQQRKNAAVVWADITSAMNYEGRRFGLVFFWVRNQFKVMRSYQPPQDYIDMLNWIQELHAKRSAAFSAGISERELHAMLEEFWAVDAMRIEYLRDHPEVTAGLLRDITFNTMQ